MCRRAGWEETRLAVGDQTGAGVVRGGRKGGRVPAPALRVGFLSPSRAGRGGAFRVPRSSRRAGAWGRGVAAAAAAGGSRLSLGSGVGDGGVEAAVSARLSVSRRRRLKNWELGTRAPDLPPPPPPRRGRCCRRPEPKAPGPGEPGGGRASGPGGGWGMARTPGPAPLCPGGGKAQLSSASPPGAGLLLPPPTPPPLLLLLFPLLLFSRLCGR